MDSIASLIVLVGAVAFVGSWIAKGSRFNYLGLQVAFSFYLVGLSDFSASNELAPARDRFIGILLALVVMWFVFDQIWPLRTVTAMRRVLASVLRTATKLFLLIDIAEEHDQLLRETERLRDRLAKNASSLRTMSEVVEYEFGVDREQHIRSSELILQISITAAALIWNQVAVLHDEQGIDFLAEPGLVEMRRRLANRLNLLAEAVVRRPLCGSLLGLKNIWGPLSAGICWEASTTVNMLEIQSRDMKTCRLWPRSLAGRSRVVEVRVRAPVNDFARRATTLRSLCTWF